MNKALTPRTDAIVKDHCMEYHLIQLARSLESELSAAQQERDNWIEDARRRAGNEDYWRERAEAAESRLSLLATGTGSTIPAAPIIPEGSSVEPEKCLTCDGQGLVTVMEYAALQEKA